MAELEAKIENQEVNTEINLTVDGGVVKKLLVKGTPGTHPPKDSDVFVHYTGTLLSDGTKFDSSYDRNQPFSFKLGGGRVIKGWDIGVATMNVGEKSVFTIKPEYGYGAQQAGDKIPPNSTLVFEVELLRFTDEKDLSEKHDESIMKKILKAGEEGGMSPNDDSTVTVDYVLSLKGGDEVERKTQATFALSEGHADPALETAIKDMKKGEHARVTIAPSAGEVANVPKDAVRVYDITLTDFVKPKATWEMTVEEKFETCAKQRAEGNDLYRAGNVAVALRRYNRALECVQSEYQMSDDDKKKAVEQKISLHLNIAACMMAKKDYKEAIAHCGKALEHDKDNLKALVRRAKCYNIIDDWDSCQADVDKVLELDAENKDAKKELAILKRKRAIQDQKDKKRFKSFFGSRMAKLEEEDKKQQEKFDEEAKKINTLPAAEKKEEECKCCKDGECKDGCCKDGKCCDDCKYTDACECKKATDCKCCKDGECKDGCCKDGKCCDDCKCTATCECKKVKRDSCECCDKN